jgi:LPS export ABC transporter protein LptC
MRSPAQRARTLKNRLVAGTAIVAGGLLAYGLLVERGDVAPDATQGDDERGYYLKRARLVEHGPDGAPRIVLRAASIEQQLADQSVLLTDIEVDYNAPDAGAWMVTAGRGRMLPGGKALLLSGDVLVQGTEESRSAVIRTDELTYDTGTSVIQTAEPVNVQFGEHRLEGRGLRIVLNAGTLRLESNVHGRFNP